MEGGIFESKGLKVNLGKTKVVVSGAEGEVSGIILWEVSNGKFSDVCEMQEMDPWKMCESKEGDPKVGKTFCLWKMQEASSWISRIGEGVV